MTASGGSNADGARHASQRPPSAAFEQFRRGEIALDEYLSTRVEAAVEHLRGRISAEKLEAVRAVVRDSLAADPGLAERVRQLVGGEGAVARSE